MRKTRLEIAAMFSLEKQIGDYCIKQTDQSVVIDQRKSLVLSFFDLIFGLIFMAPFVLFTGACLLKNGLLGVKPSLDSSQISIGHWLIILPFLCIPVFFAYVGAFIAFARSHVEATREQFLRGNTWCGVPLKLKATPVSEISSVQLTWERGGGFGGSWFCIVKALPLRKAKPIRLFSCSKKESALELARAVAEITNLPVQDIPQS